jgi:hypothetical protein
LVNRALEPGGIFVDTPIRSGGGSCCAAATYGWPVAIS